MSSIVGANVGSAWINLRFSARGSEKQLQRDVDEQVKGVGDSAGKRIGDNITRSVDSSTKGIASTVGRNLSSKLLSIRKSVGNSHKGLLGDMNLGANKLIQQLGQLSTAGTAFINPITVAIAALVAIISGPLVAALLPITAGFIGFGKIAVNAWQNVTKAIEGGHKAIKKLPADLKPLVPQVRGLQNQWAGLVKAVRPTVIQALGSALKVVRQLMPSLKPLIIAAAKAFAQFFKNVSSWLKSPSGKKFLNWLKTEGPKDIAKFGRFMWDMAQLAGRTFSWLRNAGNTWLRNVKRTVRDATTAYRNMKQWLWNDFALKIVNFFTKTIPNGYHTFVSKTKGFYHSVVNALISLPGRLRSLGAQAINQLWRGALSLAGKVVGWFKGLGSTILGTLNHIFGRHSPSREFHNMGQDLMRGLVNGLTSHFGKVKGTIGVLGKNVRSWVVQALRMTHSPMAWLNPLLTLVSKESGGNPRAVNPTGVMGQHATGLFQTLPSTFAAYSLGGSITNPVADAIAGIRYIKATYGSPFSIPGLLGGAYQGYDSGGVASGLGFLPKYTPKPERVLSPRQTAAFERLVDAIDGRQADRVMHIKGGKVEFDPAKSEMWFRDLAVQEARSEIRFAH